MIITTLNAIYQMPTTHDDDINAWLTVKCGTTPNAARFSYHFVYLSHISYFLFFWNLLPHNLWCLRLGSEKKTHNNNKIIIIKPKKRTNEINGQICTFVKWKVPECTLRTVNMHSKRFLFCWIKCLVIKYAECISNFELVSDARSWKKIRHYH